MTVLWKGLKSMSNRESRFSTTYFIWDPMRTAFVRLKIASIFSASPEQGSLKGYVLRFLHQARDSLRPRKTSQGLGE